ncbi:probable disease resistance protein At4g27220 isoform X2 [Juglans microcarpa x Juglans regia]|uniref:probable disease resistance protein At4g27220 isoform X2 n=1 Tax=Juglans microcarpa x Juglans regia TaxID=2249226 RepID=UPI001B7ECD90|nr:probable disease resistance protein At4g27220 isoform X2 [Juglans microcarpa x Juglans regia]
MEVVGAIASAIVEYIVGPVGQWLCYSCRYGSNMEDLKNQVKCLQDAKNKVQHSICAAIRNGEEIEDDVNTWLTKASAIIELATTKIHEGEEEEVETRRSNIAACLNLRQRHQLSQEAKNIVENIAELLKNRDFNRVSYRPALEAGTSVTTRYMDYVNLQSRMSVAKGIMEALEDANINKIGVWGMAGVGKSTLMREIARKVNEEKLFDEVAMAIVSESPDLRRIQGEIADMLGLKFDQETEKGRASHLRSRLSKDKKILVILDDIWKQLDLVEIGIIPSERCKIVLTSRNRDVLTCRMGTQKDFAVQTLLKEEAWDLFEKMAGESVKDPSVRGIATEVAKECAGLPIALVTVSKALKNKSLGEWKDALRQLRRLAPRHVTEMLKTVYSPIELSYKNLESQQLKSLLLLCSQLRAFVFYRDLLKYCCGYGFFHDGIDTLEEARNMLDSLLGKLRDSCLLLENFIHGIFRMHDIVRDVATIIASEDHNMFVIRDDGGLKTWPDVDSLKRCEALSILGGDIHQLPNEMECPELRFFHVHLEDRSLQIPDTFFQGMDKLEVLDLTKMQLSSLPSSLLLLGNLQTLCLDQCVLGDMSGIGELKNLVILSFLHSNISKLPREIESLVRLRLLDLSNCSKLEMIPPNVISSLVKLEELYLGNSFVQWDDEGLNDERKNASLAEFKHLSNLTSLEIQIPDVNNLPKDLMFEKLERYTICIGDVWDWIDSTRQTSRTLKLKFNPCFQLQSWVKLLWKGAEDLHLDELNGVESVIPEMDREGLQQLKHLHIQNSAELKYILNLRTPVIAFPTLETFALENMISLEEICHGKLRLTSFKNLRVLKVISCDKLRYVFSSSIARGLPLLEELEIKSCNNMGAIVVKEEERGIEDGYMISFPRLETLVLEDVPKLVSFLSTNNSFMRDGGEISHDPDMSLLHDQVAFHNLKTLHLDGLPKIKHVWSKDSQIISMFQNLQVVNAWRCESLKSLFPASIVRYLKQLKEIMIVECGVEEIVAVEGGGDQAVARSLVFPRVTCLHLIQLSRLKWFYQGMHISEWPMLETLLVIGCEKVEILASGLVSFQETVQESPPEMCIKQPLFLVDEMSFRSLETLHLIKMDKLEILWHDQVAASSFSNTRLLMVIGCENLLRIFQSNLLTTFQSLTSLHIMDCGSLEAIFERHDALTASVPTSLPQLEHLTDMTLSDLPKLEWFLEGMLHALEFPSLKKLQVLGCHKANFFASKCLETSHRINQLETCIQQPIFVVEEVTFPDLEVLILNFEQSTVWPGKFSVFPSFLARLQNLLELQVYYSGWEEIFPNELLDREKLVPRLRKLELHCLPMLTHLWKGDAHEPCPIFHTLDILQVSQCAKLKSLMPHSVSLQNLTNLKISNCHGLINLVTSSTAKTLVQLKEMTISECKRITEIVAMEDGEANVTITFNNLTYLELDSLPNLTNFCSGGYSSVMFPSLEKVIIRCCTEMKTFCHGVLSTPKLKGVQATEDEDDLHWEHDLNTTIHWLWEADYDTRLLFTQKQG